MERKGMMGILLCCFLVVITFPADSLAEKPDFLSVAVQGDFTGPYASVGGPTVPGVEDAIQYVNEELGGIDGVKLKMVVRDCTGKASLGLQQYAELMGMKPKPLFDCIVHTPTAEALREKFVQDGVIGFVPASVRDLYPLGNSYSYYALYPEQAALTMKWLRANWKEKRNPRVAILTWNQSFGRAILTPEFFDYCKKMKVDIVAQELFGVRDVDVTTHMLRIRAKNPDWVISNITGPGPLAILRAIKELGMNVKFANNVGIDWGNVRLDPELFEGTFGTLHMVSYDNPDHPGMKKVFSYLRKNNRVLKEQTQFYVIGWQYVLMIHKVVTDAVAKVGWDKLNIDAIKYELNNLTNWEPLDGLVKVTYTDKSRHSHWLRIYTVKGGKLVPAGGKLGGAEFIEAPDMTPAKYR